MKYIGNIDTYLLFVFLNFKQFYIIIMAEPYRSYSETTFKKSYNKLKTADKVRLKKFLYVWKTHSFGGAINVSNLGKEHFLDEKTMDDLLKTILVSIGSKGKIGDELIMQVESRLLSRFRNKCQLKGGTILCDTPISVGTLIPLPRFRKHLLQQFSYSEPEVDSFLENIEAYLNNNPQKKIFLKPADYLVWVTFCKKTDNSDPFCFNPELNKEILLTSLGLGYRSYLYKKVYVFKFYTDRIKNFNGCSFYRPTFCDAEFGIYFRPPPEHIHNMD